MTRLTISAASPEAQLLARAAGVLAQGGLVAYPTDTFYGLAADPRDARAVGAVYEVKGREARVALPLIAASLEQVESGAGACSVMARRLAAAFWPGPLTVIIDALPILAAAVHGGTGTVAVRVPDHAVARALAEMAGTPITSTSANRSGEPAPSSADEVLASLGDRVDLVIDSGATPGGAPSTIIDARGGMPRLVRAGTIPYERILEALR